jgi:hypothetical protein
MPDFLEPEFAEPFKTWKATPGPDANASMLKTLQPTIDKAISTHVGQSSPLLTSRARKMTLDALHSYDPNRSRLGTHLFNQLQGLKRVQRRQTTVLSVPERVSLDRYHLEEAERSLGAELGREPTDHELADHTGFSFKRMAHIRSYKPAVSQGLLETLGEGQVFGGVQGRRENSQDMWLRMVYDDLNPFDQKVMEHAIGFNGRPLLPNHEIAHKLNRSPGFISQRKKYIQQLMDQEPELSPFYRGD